MKLEGRHFSSRIAPVNSWKGSFKGLRFLQLCIKFLLKCIFSQSRQVWHANMICKTCTTEYILLLKIQRTK